MTDKIHVTLAMPMDEKLPEQVRALDPRIEVTHLTRAQRRAFRGGRPLWGGYGEPPTPEDESEEEAKARLEEVLQRTEVLLCNPVVPPDLIERAPSLRWVQLSSAGIDRLAGTPLVESSVTFTTASGIHAATISEYVIGGILAFAKGFPRALRAKQDRSWQQYMPDIAEGRTIGIIGAGHIGARVGRTAKAMGMRVLGTRRSVTQRQTGEQAGLPDIDEMFPPSDLHHVLAESDYVVIATPLTPETRGLIGPAELDAMKPSAVIVNIARGAVIDEPAMIDALKTGRIAGAVLDVFSEEPLPHDNELWGLDNVIMTPHVSGGMPNYMERVIDLFIENLRRYRDNQPLRNSFDPTRGY